MTDPSRTKPRDPARDQVDAWVHALTALAMADKLPHGWQLALTGDDGVEVVITRIGPELVINRQGDLSFVFLGPGGRLPTRGCAADCGPDPDAAAWVGQGSVATRLRSRRDCQTSVRRAEGEVERRVTGRAQRQASTIKWGRVASSTPTLSLNEFLIVQLCPNHLNPPPEIRHFGKAFSNALTPAYDTRVSLR